VLQKQCDEQTNDSAVAIQERVDRLELHVGKPGLDQRRQGIVRVQSLLERGHELGHDLWRRRNEPGVAGPRAPDPVLCAANGTGRLVGSAHSSHQAFVDLAQETCAQRQPHHTPGTRAETPRPPEP
jgi:hypothetical protein